MYKPEVVEKHVEERLKDTVFKERLKKREIWINGDINNNLVEKLYVNVIDLNEQSHDSIMVMINSFGGDMYEAVVATDIMKTVSSPIITVALAEAISAGFIIFMGGDRRIVHSNTWLMMHPPAMWGYDKIPSIQNRIDSINKTVEKMAVFFAKQTEGKTSVEFWKKLLCGEKDVYFTSDEALKLGLAHQIIGDEVERDNRYLWKV